MYHQIYLEIQPLKLEDMSCGKQKKIDWRKRKNKLSLNLKPSFSSAKEKGLHKKEKIWGTYGFSLTMPI